MDVMLFVLVPAIAVAALGGVVALRRRRGRPPAPQAAGPGGRTEIDAEVREVALLDLDDLTGVNVAVGYDTGDHLLHAVGDVLHRALPEGAEMERLESGRFVIWHPHCSLREARVQTERLRALAAQTLVPGPEGPVSRRVSAGLAPGRRGESRNRAILRAGAALARAKEMGGDRTEMAGNHPVPSLAPARAEIKAAIATRALEYHVQPILRLDTRKPVGVEALIRWNRPDGAVLGPAHFLDTLDRIPEAGADLLPDLAVDAASPFVRVEPPIYVTFNITGAVLDGHNSPACRWLSEILDRLPPNRLVLEIVETAVVVYPERAIDLAHRLRSRGVRIALDDFGTGLSNLGRLRLLPVDILKIDRVFVDGLGDAGREEAILESMVTLAERLDIDLVAEGIETEAQAATLRDLGVHYGQGYLLGRPAPAAEWASRWAAGVSA